LRSAYAGAALAVFAPHQEEFGIAPLEAMASGLPVVGWREGGLLETILHDSTGYLAGSANEFATRVNHLWQDRELAVRLGRAGRERASQFSWDRTAEIVERVCASVVRQSPTF
jgi:glycosyltransferase involved in cell wall biosynthesis